MGSRSNLAPYESRRKPPSRPFAYSPKRNDHRALWKRAASMPPNIPPRIFQRFAGSQSETLTVSVKPDAISRA
jgi:hypothetical protein